MASLSQTYTFEANNMNVCMGCIGHRIEPYHFGVFVDRANPHRDPCGSMQNRKGHLPKGFICVYDLSMTMGHGLRLPERPVEL